MCAAGRGRRRTRWRRKREGPGSRSRAPGGARCWWSDRWLCGRTRRLGTCRIRPKAGRCQRRRGAWALALSSFIYASVQICASVQPSPRPSTDTRRNARSGRLLASPAYLVRPVRPLGYGRLLRNAGRGRHRQRARWHARLRSFGCPGRNRCRRRRVDPRAKRAAQALRLAPRPGTGARHPLQIAGHSLQASPGKLASAWRRPR